MVIVVVVSESAPCVSSFPYLAADGSAHVHDNQDVMDVGRYLH